MVAVIGDAANAASIRLHAALGFRHAGVLTQRRQQVRPLARRRADAARARAGRRRAGAVAAMDDERRARRARALGATRANYVPLSPVQFLERSALVYPDKIAVRHGARAYTYREFEARCRRLASALARRGIGRGDTVAVMAPNVPALLEAHYAVPCAGRGAQRAQLPARRADDRLHPRARRGQAADHRPRVRARRSKPRSRSSSARSARHRHRRSAGSAAASGSARSTTRRCSPRATPASPGAGPRDEWDAIALLYTSGTTGNPKGVVYHHRGAYLNALGNALAFGLRPTVRLSVDAADVPLQRLDLHLGGDRGRRHARLPAPGRSGADLRGDRASTG